MQLQNLKKAQFRC